MTEGARLSVDGGAVLRLAPHAKFRFDEVRQAWIVLAPERLLLPDEQAVEILQLIDGERAVDGVIDELVRRRELAGVALDGPLTRGLRLVRHYRAAEAILSRGPLQKRGKPGPTSAPMGQKLHEHATKLAK